MQYLFIILSVFFNFSSIFFVKNHLENLEKPRSSLFSLHPPLSNHCLHYCVGVRKHRLPTVPHGANFRRPPICHRFQNFPNFYWISMSFLSFFLRNQWKSGFSMYFQFISTKNSLIFHEFTPKFVGKIFSWKFRFFLFCPCVFIFYCKFSHEFTHFADFEMSGGTIMDTMTSLPHQNDQNVIRHLTNLGKSLKNEKID